jgi:hypothetical protein
VRFVSVVFTNENHRLELEDEQLIVRSQESEIYRTPLAPAAKRSSSKRN